MQSLLSNTYDLLSKKFGVFNEMEMEINIINNEIFTKLYLKIRVSRKVKSKPHERMDLLITTSVNIYRTKKYSGSNENMLF